MNIGKKIKEYREIRRLSQRELGEAIGVSDKTISSWEVNRTEPSIPKLKELCRVLNVKLPEVIGYDGYIDLGVSYTDDANESVADGDTQTVIEVMGNPGLRVRLIEYASFLLSDFGDGKSGRK